MENMDFSNLNNENNNQAPRNGGARNNSDAQGDRNSDPKRRRKLIWAGIILAALILAVIGWQYWQYTHSMYYRQMQAVKYLEKMAKESDKWGGKTPEETVRLFTEAVKKGDFDLASKYGPSEESLKLIEDPTIRDQKSIKKQLEKMKSDGRIEQLIKDLESAKLEENPGFNGNNYNLVIYESGKKYWLLSLGKSDGGTWKIDEF